MSPTVAVVLTVQEGAVKTEGGSEEGEAADENKPEEDETEKTGESEFKKKI